MDDRPSNDPIDHSVPGPHVGDPSPVPDAPPTLPSRSAFLGAFLSIVVAGAFGGVIGYGLADLGTDGESTIAPLLGALVGAAIAAGGVGVVAVLVLRAQAEWRRMPPPLPQPDPSGTPPPDRPSGPPH